VPMLIRPKIKRTLPMDGVKNDTDCWSIRAWLISSFGVDSEEAKSWAEPRMLDEQMKEELFLLVQIP
jgi:hypothetical protein